LYEHLDELSIIHPAARQISVEFTLKTMPVPLHPGAARYYEEIGARVPDHLLP
jgi:TRAP-type uncharacterized transport system substrate-binding protein